ncbi:BamA/TamA family outer membrane protein [Candidatus Poribacteria bacterium]|nr:BamA/TamA family outer membrane protein [Candidatus Poribacteria bacterium]
MPVPFTVATLGAGLAGLESLWPARMAPGILTGGTPAVTQLIGRRLLALVVCVMTILAAGPLAARQQLPTDGTLVTEILVHGCAKTSDRDILRVMDTKPGEPFSAEALRRDMQAIADLGHYNPLTINITSEDTGGGVRLVVTVDENPVVKRITFVGNVTYKTERLEREIDFKAGDILPLAAKTSTARSIQTFYANGGYKTTRVTVSIEPADEPNTVNVQINVDEGQKIKIRDLKIEGNKHFSGLRLRLRSTNSGSWLFFNNFYDDRAFEDDLRAIEAMYRDAGYLDARATRGEFLYNSDKAWVSPVIHIEEGPRYKLTGVNIEGVTLFDPSEIETKFAGRVGETYNGEKVRAAIAKARRMYGDEGYVNAEFDGRFDRDAAAGTVTLNLKITENNKVYVGRVLLQKQDYEYDIELNALERFMDWSSPGVKDETVLKEVRLKPGALYRTADEVRTVERLRRLGFFEKVNVRREPTDDPNISDAVVEVKEDPGAGFVGVTVGVGELSGPAIGLNYTNPNLFGEAKVAKANVTIGRRLTAYSLGYLDRDFNDSGDSLELSAYRTKTHYKGYSERVYGAWAEYGDVLEEDPVQKTRYIRTRLEQVDLARSRQDLREDVDSYVVAAARAYWVRDERNDLKWPSKGRMIGGGFEVGRHNWDSAGGSLDDYLLKFMHEFQWYKSLDSEEDWVYAYQHQAGLLPYDAHRDPIGERFFLGGTNSLRGFEPRGIGPKDKGAKAVAIGGSTMLAQRHEMRHRFNKYLRGRLFLDAGILERDPLEAGTPRVGTGAGVSFDLGAVVVDLDAAAPVVKRDHDQTRFIHFRLRSNF